VGTEPTPEQTAAANRLDAAGLAAHTAEVTADTSCSYAYGRALTELEEAVKQAQRAGVPRADVTAIASRRLLNGLGSCNAKHLRKILNRIYR
jgi:hypothetical protein